MQEPGNTKQHYRSRWLYYNKNDERIIVPKQDGIGNTLNFANKWSYIIIIAAIGVVVCTCAWLINYTHILNNTSPHYKYGIFYHNEKDNRIFIPREDGSGWTLNFANYWSYSFVLLVGLIIVYSVLRG